MESIYKWLALDLDGTLTNSDKLVSQRNIKAIHDAQNVGMNVILASGRPLLGIEHIAKRIGLYEKGGYILAYNGGHVVECKSNQTIFKELIPMEHLETIVKVGEKYHVYPLTYNFQGVIAESDDNFYLKKEAFNNSVPLIKVNSLIKEVKNPVVKFMVVGEPDELLRAREYLLDKLDGQLNLFFSEPYFLEITPLGIEKASALERLLGIYGDSSENLIAIGDGLNDLPMLNFAGYAVAMGNAYDEVKLIANMITGTNDEDGVAQAIEKIIL